MITYRYSFIEDIKNTIKRIQHFKDNPDFYNVWGKKRIGRRVIYFPPSFRRWIWTVVWSIFGKKPVINMPNIKTDYTCYWVSSGSWGDCDVENKILYCMPYAIEKSYPKTLEKLIEHEVTHGEFPEAEKMEHWEKEKYIEKQEQNNI